MANGDEYNRDERPLPFTRRVYPPPPDDILPRTPAAAPRQWEEAERGATLPSTGQAPRQWEQAEQGTQPSTQPLPSTAMQTRMDYLLKKMHPEPAATRLGRFGQKANIVAQDIGAALRPDIMQNVPGTMMNRRAEYARLQGELGPQEEREAQIATGKAREQTEQERTGIMRTTAEREAAQFGTPEPLPGDMNTTPEGGQNYLHKPTGITFWVHPGEDPRQILQKVLGQQEVLGQPPAAPAAPENMPSTPQAAQPPGLIPPVPQTAPRRPGMLTPGETRGAAPRLSPEEQMREMVASIAAIPENQRTAQQQDYFKKNSVRFEKDIPITKAMADRENVRIRQNFAGVPGARPEAYFVKEGDSLADVKMAEAQARSDLTTLQATANRNMKQANQYYMYEGKMVRGNQVPADATDAVLIKDPVKMKEKMTAVDGFIKQLDRYQGSFDASAGKLTRDDIAALETLTEANVAHGFAEELIGAVSDFVAGKPLQGYSEKVMKGVMTEEQYNRMSPAGKDLLTKYYNTIIGNFANIRERLNAIGRNESMIQAEIHTIPLPYIDHGTAVRMLGDKRADVAENAWWLTPEDIGRRQGAGATAQPSAPGAPVIRNYNPKTRKFE